MLKLANTNSFDSKVIYIVSIFSSTVIFYDIFVFKVNPDPLYIFSRLFFHTSPFIFSYLIKKFNIRFLTVSEFTIVNYFVYAAYYSITINYSYFFAYLQVGLLTAGLLQIRKKVYPYIMIPTTVSAFITLNYASVYPEFIGLTEFKTNMTSVLLYIFIPIGFTYYFVSLKAEETRAKEKIFTDIGKRLGFILHEIKRPLMTIEGKTNQSFHLEEFEEIKEIVDLANEKKKNVTLEKTEVPQIINEVLSYYSNQIEALNIKVTTNISSSTQNINKTRFTIVLKNLLKNSIEECINNDRENRQIDIILDEVLTIKNPIYSQRSLESEDLTQPFFTTKDNSTNHGLGLYLCRKLLDEMNLSLKIKQKNNSFEASILFS